MARFAVAAAAVVAVVCRSEGLGTQPGEYGYDDKGNFLWEFTNPQKVPGHDKCGVDCFRICKAGLGRTAGRSTKSNSDCLNSCYAHSIETPHAAASLWDTNHQQGKYVQKVMAEFCDRGLCGAGLLQAQAVQEHVHQQGGEYSPGSSRGDPRAMPKGWPTGCESKSYYCQEMCQNLYHKPTSNLGEHFGASAATWSSDQALCKSDCSKNFDAMTQYWHEWCTCFKSPGGNMHLEIVPGLLQMYQHEEPVDGRHQQDADSVDVGSFLQVSVEL